MTINNTPIVERLDRWIAASAFFTPAKLLIHPDDVKEVREIAKKSPDFRLADDGVGLTYRDIPVFVLGEG